MRVPNRKGPFAAVQYKHDLGQHFLYDMGLLRALVAKTGLTGGDTVLEIGPGAGTLTQVLCETAANVTAVEVDEALMPRLEELTSICPNLNVIHKDIRKLNLYTLMQDEPFWVVANIPYSITSQIFDLFWGTNLPVQRMCVMVQKEVAEKLTATPGDPAYGLMSVRCAYYCVPEIVGHIPASAFTPPPKVDSAFVSLAFRTSPPAPVKDEPLLWRLMKAGYGLRRKTLINALKPVLTISSDMLRDILTGMALPQDVRGETLHIEQWIALANAVSAARTSPSLPAENR